SGRGWAAGCSMRRRRAAERHWIDATDPDHAGPRVTRPRAGVSFMRAATTTTDIARRPRPPMRSTMEDHLMRTHLHQEAALLARSRSTRRAALAIAAICLVLSPQAALAQRPRA